MLRLRSVPAACCSVYWKLDQRMYFKNASPSALPSLFTT